MLTEKPDFDELYNTYKNLIMKAAYKYSGNYSIAEDIAQEVLLKLYIYIDGDRLKYKNIKAWLFTTAKNMALNYNKKIEKEVFQDTEKEEWVTSTDSSAEDEFMEKSLDLDRENLHSTIFAELMRKNARWYEAIYLVYYLELPQAVVAEKMGIRLEVLHSLLHRAREWIKRTFGVEYDELKRL